MEPMKLEEFDKEIRSFAAAFGRTLTDEAKLQYYRVLSPLGGERVSQLLNWAIESLDTSLPSIARLRKRGLELGWFARNGGENEKSKGVLRRTEPIFIRITCPKCDGEIVVRKRKLEEDAASGAEYECANRLHWGCTMSWRATSILDTDLKPTI
jgi:hypothetical protein